MPLGIFLIMWDEIEGGSVYLNYPNDLNIPVNIVQQIQISHNFIESYIAITELNWNSLSYYNEKTETIIVLVLDKYDDSSDYKIIIEDFNKELGKNLSDEKILELLKKAMNTDVFRTKDEVIAKLSNEVAQLRMKEYDYERKIENISKIDFLSVRSRILILLAKNPELSIKELRKIIKTSKKWLESVIETLQKNKIIDYDSKKDGYYLIF